jgi:hypothetical protein
MIVTQSPTSMPLTPTGTPLQMAKDTLPPTPVPTDDYLSRISLHQPGVTCVCSANDPDIIEVPSPRLPSETPTTAFPTIPAQILRSPGPSSEPPFYTDLPTTTSARQRSHTNKAARESLDYVLDATWEVGSDDDDKFVVTSHTETECFRVSGDESYECQLDCIVTISIYHLDVLISEPTTDAYSTPCHNGEGSTVTTRSLETHTFAVDSIDAFIQDHGN